MAERAHTPGPWRMAEMWRPPIGKGPHAGLVDGNVFWGYSISGSNEGGGDILPTLAAVHNFPGQVKANARLVAAAPDLLEALQAMYRVHHLHIFSPRGQETRSDRDTCRICGGNYRDTLQHITAQEGHPSDVKAEAARLARAAIARATGETP